MKRAIPVLLALIGLLVYPAQAQPFPEVISFQGRLTDPNGQPVPDGAYQLTFRLYDQPNGGTLQWTETQVVTTRKGLFTALLGSVSPLSGLSFDEGYYVALGVNGSAELGPRTALAAVPYALSAQRLDEAALEAGSNVTITRQNDGALRIEAAGGGTGGGLTRVSTDATLTGEGTAGSPLSLADGSVTGAKLSDAALRAGSNTTITRQGDGSLEIAASGGGGLSLPYAGSVNSNEAALNIENTGAGNGLQIDQAGHNGIQIGQTTFDGIQIQSAGRDGVFVVSAGEDGVLINSAGRYGLNVVNASRGVDIHTTTDDGILMRNPGRHGLTIQNAASKGIQIDQAGNNGLQIDQTNLNGIQIGQTTFDGIQIQSPGRDGIRVSGAGGLAGNFGGDVDVTGTLTKGGGSFKIDHPLDPAGKYLSHSFVESPDMKNVYDGTVTTDARGEAFIALPDYFEALNRDFRYQLTAIGVPGPNLYVAEEIQGNRFKIAGGTAGMKVSWQVTGIRRDAWAEANRIVVEEAKPIEEQGYYLHPEALGLPVERGLTARTAARQQPPAGSH